MIYLLIKYLLKSNYQEFFEINEVRPIEEVYTGYTYFRDGDVLLAKVTPCFENGKSGIAHGLTNGVGFGSSEFFVLRPKTEYVLPEYIYRLISTDTFIEQGRKMMTGTGGLQRIPRTFLENYLIPLPPLTVQEEIVAEIENYQRIIDGARQVVDNYKPTIRIDPAWEKKRLDSLCTLITKGTTPMTLGFEFVEDGINFVKIESITSSGKIDRAKMPCISEKCHEALKRSQLECNDILFSIAGSMGTIALVNNDILPANTNQALCIIRLKDKRYAEFVSLFLRSATIEKKIEKIKVGVARYPLLSKTNV